MVRFASTAATLLLLASSACGPSSGGGGTGTDAGHDAPDGGAADGGDGDGGTVIEAARATALIGPEGGQVSLDGATLIFQVGSLAAETEIVFEHDPEGGPAEALSGTWSILPEHLVLVSPAEIRLPRPAGSEVPALVWERHPDFGSGEDRLDAWVEGDHLVGQLYYTGAGHLAPAHDRGVVVYHVNGGVFEARDGIVVTPEPLRDDYVWRATGGGGTSSGPVETSPNGLSRAGPLHPGATRHARCLSAPQFCFTTDLGLRDAASVWMGRADAETDATLGLEASNLFPLDEASDYLFATENIYNADWRSGAEVIASGGVPGASSATVSFSPMNAVDPAAGDRSWLFEYTAHDEGAREVSRLSGFDELEALSVPETGHVAASSVLTPLAADDLFTVQLDTAAWTARIPDMTALYVSVYGTWGRWAPWEEHGAPLLVARVPLSDLGSPVELALPSSPIPEWTERVFLEADGVYWEVPRDQVDGQVLAAPPIGQPTAVTFDGTGGDPSTFVTVDASDGVTIEWQAPDADQPVSYLLMCSIVDSANATARANFRTASRSVFITPGMLAGLSDYAHGFCYLGAEKAPDPVYGAPAEAVASTVRWWRFQTF